MLAWFQRQQIGSRSDAPIAPTSVHGVAENWEPSVQNFVCERGGFAIEDLDKATREKWAFQYKIEKVWRAKDAISDRGIHAYIQHHWLILKLTPVSGPFVESSASRMKENTLESSSQEVAPTQSGDPESKEERIVLTDERSLSQEQEQSFEPVEDLGMQQADEGSAWYLRIDRFDQADKWFACGSFENALSSKQARDKHFSPTSQLLYAARRGSDFLYLECILPLLLKLAEIKYSVFAKGYHCQWHALVVARIIATLHEFAFPNTIDEEFKPQVSSILTDSKEQLKYTNRSAQSYFDPDSAYLRDHPEAPYLKSSINSLRQICTDHPGKLPSGLLSRKFPDVDHLYKVIVSGLQ